jgi:hypothetical protein
MSPDPSTPTIMRLKQRRRGRKVCGSWSNWDAASQLRDESHDERQLKEAVYQTEKLTGLKRSSLLTARRVLLDAEEVNQEINWAEEDASRRNNSTN